MCGEGVAALSMSELTSFFFFNDKFYSFMFLSLWSDLCLKWRVLPSPSNYEEEFPDMWICANNPNNLENR